MADIIFDASSSIESFSQCLKRVSQNNASVLILSCDANNFNKEKIDTVLKQSSVAIVGALFPSVIYNAKKYDTGTLFIGLSDTMHINIIHNISQKRYGELDNDIEKQIDMYDESVKTMFVFIDGLSKHIGECINVLFDNYGLDVNYIGGGSGSLSFQQKPSLFTNQGLLQDALVYAYSKRKSSIGVYHGWKSISGPYEVTASEGTVVKELDYESAFNVYKRIVDKYSLESIDAKNFFKISKLFPFGINRISNEKIVRDPILLDGKDMVCVGDIEKGSYVDILQGSKSDLINAVKYAADSSFRNMHHSTDFTLFIDCVSRSLFLEESYELEIKAACRHDKQLVGALTFGEIANDGKNYLEFFNKTSVIGRIGYG